MTSPLCPFHSGRKEGPALRSEPPESLGGPLNCPLGGSRGGGGEEGGGRGARGGGG